MSEERRHSVLHDPDCLVTAGLPTDCGAHERLLRAVLSWTDPAALPPDDYEQVGLLLTGAGHFVADDVRQRADKLPADDPRRTQRIVLGEADRRLTEPGRNTLDGVKRRARMLQSLYQPLDRLQQAKGDAAPDAPAGSPAP
ncbi:DUF6415 family natural product biosynthesis protein [Streptomyces sp. NPDC059928]|uniref:DUF6415 family natural product biosynthesis protein n=1 Tax=unclassified Streptomyces TaxID=2593676 RepID=UPI003652BDE8